MVIPMLPCHKKGGAEELGREGIRWKTGAVPATVIAFCVQRTKNVTGASPWEDALPGKSQETCHFAKRSTILGIKDEKHQKDVQTTFNNVQGMTVDGPKKSVLLGL